jgi:hypothetical protein
MPFYSRKMNSITLTFLEEVMKRSPEGVEKKAFSGHSSWGLLHSGDVIRIQ